MPELPEVETIRSALENGGREGSAIIGLRVDYAELLWQRTLAVPDEAAFLTRIHGQVVCRVRRRAKYLDICLESDHLLMHLRMSGDVRVEPHSAAQQKHDRLVIWFEGGQKLVFNDPRKFGRVWFVQDPDEVLLGLGPEPLAESFTTEFFFARLQKHNRRLKPLLMDQAFLAGMGNIYTDEALFMAKLHPLTIASTLSIEEAEDLRIAIVTVLLEGIRRNGASIDWVYRGGSFQNVFQVYGRGGEFCNICGTPIARIVVGQRGTHFCPQCQPLKLPEN